MKRFFFINRMFFIPYFCFLFITGFFLLIYNKDAIHIAINRNHWIACDYFFKYITHLGDGRTAFLVVIAFLFIKFRYALVIATSSITAGLIAQLLKRFVFAGYFRPRKYFENIYDLYIVTDVNLHDMYSFPSGHTTTVFTLACCVALLLPDNKQAGRLVLLIIAILTGFSRIYLSQHFLVDVFFGSLLGVTVASVFYFVFRNMACKKMEKSLLTLKTNSHK